MRTNRHNRLRALLKSPVTTSVMGALAALVAAPLIRWADAHTGWVLLGYSADGARALLGAMVTSLLTFIVFVFSFLLLAVQVAGGQLSPRIITRMFASRRLRVSLGVFVFTYTYALAAIGRVEARVPQLPVLIAVILSLINLLLFIYLIQWAGQALRPIAVLTNIAVAGRVVIERVYPNRLSDSVKPPAVRPRPPLGDPRAVIHHAGRSGVLLSFDSPRLTMLAAGGVIELVPQVGDFVQQSEPLFRIYGDTPVNERSLQRCVRVGPERTLEQDPAFAFRIMVDIAIKALSPAINDPTTAVQAIDHLQDLLHQVGTRELGAGEARDAHGRVRLVYPAPSWEDFVCLAVAEIRGYGSGSLQVCRRLRAMLEHLHQTLPEKRAPAIEAQLQLLQHAITRSFADPEDRLLAEHCDDQGLGGGRPKQPPAPEAKNSKAPENPTKPDLVVAHASR